MNILLQAVFLIFLITLGGCSDDHLEVPIKPEVQQYIVVLKSGALGAKLKPLNLTLKQQTQSQLMTLSKKYDAKVYRTFSLGLQGGVYKMTLAQAKQMSLEPSVAYVEEDHVVTINSVQASPTWGLDRIDQAQLPLDKSYTHVLSAENVNAYVIDTGVYIEHSDFEGRAQHGFDFVDNDYDSTDCNGHGTHVAGTIGGARYGVAKSVNIYGVRVLDCAGSGRFSDVIAGIEWVNQNHISPAVANLSLGGPVSQAVDDAVKAAIQAGVTFVVAAGNSNTSACSSSPSRVSEAITVGSTTGNDARSSFSNYGACVNIFAPGTDVTSTWINSRQSTNTISGTSMASPHVAGVAALLLSAHPNATPSEVAAGLYAQGVSGTLSGIGTGSPNILVNMSTVQVGDGDENNSARPVELFNGSEVNNISGNKGSEKFYTISVPLNSVNLTYELSGGTGDADLYVKFGAKPSLSDYDCRPYKAGNNEVCKFESASAGVWHVMIRAYSDFSKASLKINYEVIDPSPCTNCVGQEGELNFNIQVGLHPGAGTIESTTGLHKVWLVGPLEADFDLYIDQLQGGKWVKVAASINLKSTEKIAYQGVPGTYRYKVTSYSGVGKYKIWFK